MIRMILAWGIETGLLFISPNHMQDLYLGTYSGSITHPRKKYT